MSKEWRELADEWNQDPTFQREMASEFPFRNVADAIIRLRAAHELTQNQLAELMGTTQSVIARAESGKHPVGTGFLNRVAEAVHVRWRPVFEDLEGYDDHNPLAAARA